jgi:hypothetical protein
VLFPPLLAGVLLLQIPRVGLLLTRVHVGFIMANDASGTCPQRLYRGGNRFPWRDAASVRGQRYFEWRCQAHPLMLLRGGPPLRVFRAGSTVLRGSVIRPLSGLSIKIPIERCYLEVNRSHEPARECISPVAAFLEALTIQSRRWKVPPRFRTPFYPQSHCGHDYGTTLSDQEKSAPLEYLKTL